MRSRSAFLLASMCLISLMLAGPAYSATPCTTQTLVGSYAMALGGVNGRGSTVAEMGFFDSGPANTNGFGQFSGDIYLNERGDQPVNFRTTGTYQIFSNCVVHFYVPGDGRTDVVTGFVFDNGELIIFSSIFDPTLQITGIARRAH